jgi:hypothetical protein
VSPTGAARESSASSLAIARRGAFPAAGETVMKHLCADFRRDWRRWTRGERMTASAIVAVSLLGSIALMIERL